MAATGSVQKENSKIPLAIGGVALGLVLLGFGYRWWRKPVSDEVDGEGELIDQPDDRPVESNLDEVITRIALLDSAYDRGEIQEETYRSERAILMEAARIIADSSK